VTSLKVELPREALLEIASQVAEILSESAQPPSPWMSRPAAAEYLGFPVSRLEKDRTIPCRRWDGRVFYNRHELDAFMASREAG
jgi:hypothetical protein